MLNLMDTEIITILRRKKLLNWPYVTEYSPVPLASYLNLLASLSDSSRVKISAIAYSITEYTPIPLASYLNLPASLSDSSRVKKSPSLTGITHLFL